MGPMTRRQALTGFAGTLVAVGAARFPGAAAESLGDRDRVRALLRRMTLEERVGQLFVVEVFGQDAFSVGDEMAAANQRLYGVDTPAEVIAKYRPGGVIYFTAARGPDNLHDPRQIARLSNGLQSASVDGHSGVPLVVSIDQEGGIVFRLPTPPSTALPGNMALGATRSTADALRSAEIIGRELDVLGITQNYAPVADVNVNPENPVIGVRSFGSNPELASGLVDAVVRGHRRSRVASAAKHFPGHGDTDVDSHFGLPLITHTRAELDAIDLPPFRAAIAAGVDTIMTAHIVVPALDDSGVPATMSPNIVTGLLRDELGFEGLVVTDALDMQGASEQFPPDVAPVEALKAGADMLVLAPQMDVAFAAVLDTVRRGDVSEERLDESVARILEHKVRNGLFRHPPVSERRAERVVGNRRHLTDAAAIADDTITLVRNDGNLLPLTAEPRQVLVTGWGEATTQMLSTALASRSGQTVTRLTTGAVPNQAQIDAAVTAADQSDLVLVSSNAAAAGAEQGDAQAGLVDALLGTSTHVVVVAVRNPYDIRRFTATPTYLCTYNFATAVSLDSCVNVLYGEVNPRGKLPVAITAFEDPDTELYPFGHGLSYNA
ncbi:MAG: glycoside hydrolase family 3 protein [Acidimicrobiales bacterium]